jgi:hypothetical protein
MDRTKSSAGLTTGGDTAEIHWDKKPSSHLKKCQSDLFFNLYDDDTALMAPKSNIFFLPNIKKKVRGGESITKGRPASGPCLKSQKNRVPG